MKIRARACSSVQQDLAKTQVTYLPLRKLSCCVEGFPPRRLLPTNKLELVAVKRPLPTLEIARGVQYRLDRRDQLSAELVCYPAFRAAEFPSGSVTDDAELVAGARCKNEPIQGRPICTPRLCMVCGFSQQLDQSPTACPQKIKNVA